MLGWLSAAAARAFALESLAPVRVARESARQHLQCDAPAELRVIGKVHVAHAAAAEQPFYPVMAESASSRVSHRAAPNRICGL
jgi:hypothetical protein